MDELLLAEDRDDPYDLALIVLRQPGGEGDRLFDLVPHQPWRVPLRVLALVPQGRRRDLTLAESSPVRVLTLPVHRAALLEALDERPRPALMPTPAAPVVDAAPRPVAAAVELPPAAAPDASAPRRCILLVEDNKISQKVATAMLDKLGYQVEAVDNGVLALGAVEQRHYHLVLMDIQMPEMDGLEATRRIRAAEAAGHLRYESPLGHLPIVAMTAHALASDRQLCLESGMDDVITKPVKRQVLIETLTRVLNGEAAGAADDGRT
jgi:CheY-like chemotaxis protein